MTFHKLAPNAWQLSIGPFCFSKSHGMWWFRLFRYGISCKNTEIVELLFSERNNFGKRLSIGKFMFKILTTDKPLVDLSQPAQLRFVKGDSDKYNIQFLNPVKNKWWDLPLLKAGIHAHWSFHKKGSYGAYNLYKLNCRAISIEAYKAQFKTLADIQKHFDNCNKKYEDFKRMESEHNDLPDIVH